MIVAPDTSPRGTDFAGEHASYDFGSGAGFYVDATEQPWARNYRMYSYVTEELSALVEAQLPADAERRPRVGLPEAPRPTGINDLRARRAGRCKKDCHSKYLTNQALLHLS